MHPLRSPDDRGGPCGPGYAELDRLRWTAVAFWALALALVAAVEGGFL